MGKEAVPGESEARRVPYESFSYYFAEDGIGYLIRLEQSKEREQVISITDFEEILAGLEIEKPLGTTENAVGYEKMELGGFSLWLPEGTTCEDGSLRNERAGTEFLATVPTVESITEKQRPLRRMTRHTATPTGWRNTNSAGMLPKAITAPGRSRTTPCR